MEENLGKIRISIMLVGVPAGGFNIHFNVSNPWRLAIELDDGLAEVRTRLAIQKTGVKDLQGAFVQGMKLAAPNALMPPDGLHQTFGR
jgi:hypothetical protein